ncbi:V-set and immunoglobulin domain-containing protein 4 isoform X2 [Phyllostomus discolor]|uniref:V-set and immunoglobulin domain-containing protein 4 isoform X2 n=1 Tax=Phyllostomus discolor TaxID=89673 RepID=UPI00105B1070|nr:V-set and immunoglobulin domain-containing protein 4 isoform X2 [Phyllostomus discolor]
MALAVMGLLLGLLLPDHLIVVTYGHPILEAPESVIGPWKGNVNIPCTYGPLQGYTQVSVKWLVQRDSDPVTIFLRDFSGDHIQQAKYQSRLNVNNEVPGDVSLQLKTLEMDDRNHYTCEVTWQTPDGTQVVRDEIIELRVQKHSSKSQKNQSEAPTTMQSPLARTPTVNSSWAWTTEGHSYFGDTSARPGKGLPIFVIILIISLCCMVVFSMAYIMFYRKKSQQDNVYEVFRVNSREASDPDETMRVPIFKSGCYSEDPASWTLGNGYSDEPCLDQEYQIVARINGDYDCLLNTVSLDHELLTAEGKSVC